jgi:hypothetical protein
MATADKKTTLEDQNFNSDRLSTQVRFVALGLLAVVWALVINPPEQIAISRQGLLWVACIVISSMLIDLVQYAAGYESSRRLYRDLEAGHERGYRKKGFLYRVRGWCFWGKQVGVLVAGLLFLLVVIPSLLEAAR